MKITRAALLGVSVVKLLQKDPRVFTVKDLAKKFDTTEDFLHQIIGKLRRAGLVSCNLGPGGGVVINAFTKYSSGVTKFHVVAALDPGFKEVYAFCMQDSA